jgi:hypothetical protein
MLVLSPTPPEECLSTARSTTSLRSSVSPEYAIARVKSVVSRGVMPLSMIAIANEEA